MRVVLTNLSVTGRPASSPVRARLSALSLQPKPGEDNHCTWYRKTRPFTGNNRQFKLQHPRSKPSTVFTAAHSNDSAGCEEAENL
jgi:hypothetical protein